METPPSSVLSRPFYIVSKDCGYCCGKKEDFNALEEFKYERPESIPNSSSSITMGSQLHQTDSKSYEEFVNKGFRRSGHFLYKPDMLRNCCRYYTIRTNLSMLKPTKQQRKYVNRFCREISEKTDQTSKSKTSKRPFDLSALARAEAESSRFHTRFEPSQFSEEKFALYKKYQIKVHNDKPEELSKSSFERFLCKNPFPDHEASGSVEQWETLNTWAQNYGNGGIEKVKRIGPTHDCYYLDEKLIAISVLDFLPTGVSSIYFIWDPDYANLSLGTISGLREILICADLGYAWYYLGYYIEDCPKMKYKSQFGGELLDLCNEVYFPFNLLEDHIKNGRLFVLGKEDSTNKEIPLEYDGCPVDYKDSIFHGHEMKNIASLLFNSRETYELADDAEKSIASVCGIEEYNRDGMLVFPNVIPGVIPLTQLLKWLENGTINDGIRMNFFDTDSYRMHHDRFGELESDEKETILQCIRLFGLQRVKESVIVI